METIIARRTVHRWDSAAGPYLGPFGEPVGYSPSASVTLVACPADQARGIGASYALRCEVVETELEEICPEILAGVEVKAGRGEHRALLRLENDDEFIRAYRRECPLPQPAWLSDE